MLSLVTTASLHVHDGGFLECRDDHEDGCVDGVDAVEADRDRGGSDEYQAQNDLCKAGDALRQVELPGGVVVLLIADGTDQA